MRVVVSQVSKARSGKPLLREGTGRRLLDREGQVRGVGVGTCGCGHGEVIGLRLRRAASAIRAATAAAVESGQ